MVTLIVGEECNPSNPSFQSFEWEIGKHSKDAFKEKTTSSYKYLLSNWRLYVDTNAKLSIQMCLTCLKIYFYYGKYYLKEICLWKAYNIHMKIIYFIVVWNRSKII